jgi:hypothetical protein
MNHQFSAGCPHFIEDAEKADAAGAARRSADQLFGRQLNG